MPESPPWIIENLAKRHDRASFDCGVDELNIYLEKFAGQNDRAGISQHVVAVAAPRTKAVLGYYALSAGSVAFDHVPQALARRLPRYPVPVAHIGRLAVDRSMQGKGLGEDLLIDALARIARAADEIGIHAVEVVAINDAARRFYQRYGFTTLADDELHLYLPLSTVKRLGLA